eukprot:NODE_565_length_5974_cov_1.190468.p2 type:complete len:594 gc:universal NODE_565_length_5974_cov_1.190468:3325-5106(+)
MDNFFDQLENELQDLMIDNNPAAKDLDIVTKNRRDPSKFDQFISKGEDDLMTPNDSIELLQKDLDNTLDMLNQLDSAELETKLSFTPPKKKLAEDWSTLFPIRSIPNGLYKPPESFFEVVTELHDHIQKLALKIFIYHPQTHAKSLIINQYTTALWIINHVIEKCVLPWDGMISDETYSYKIVDLGWTLIEIKDNIFKPIMPYDLISETMSSWQKQDGDIWMIPVRPIEIHSDLNSLLQGYPKMLGFLTIEIITNQDLNDLKSQDKIKKRKSMFRTPSKSKKAYRYYCKVDIDGFMINMEKNNDKKFLWKDYDLYSHVAELTGVLPQFLLESERTPISGMSNDSPKKPQFTFLRKSDCQLESDAEKIICYVEGAEKLRDWSISIRSAVAQWDVYQNPQWFCDPGNINFDPNSISTQIVTLEDDSITVHAKDFIIKRSLVMLYNNYDRLMSEKQLKKQSRGLSSTKEKQLHSSSPALGHFRINQSQTRTETGPNLGRSPSVGNTLYHQVDDKLRQKLKEQYPGINNEGPFIQLNSNLSRSASNKSTEPICPPLIPNSTLYDQLDQKKKRPSSLSSGTLYDAIQKHQGDEPYHKI